MNAVITQFWAGSSGLETHYMAISASYELLFKTPFNQIEDNEKTIREAAWSFERKKTRKLPPHSLSYIGLYQPMDMRFMTEAGVVFLTMFAAQMLIMLLYSLLKTDTFLEIQALLMADRRMELRPDQV